MDLRFVSRKVSFLTNLVQRKISKRTDTLLAAATSGHCIVRRHWVYHYWNQRKVKDKILPVVDIPWSHSDFAGRLNELAGGIASQYFTCRIFRWYDVGLHCFLNIDFCPELTCKCVALYMKRKGYKLHFQSKQINDSECKWQDNAFEPPRCAPKGSQSTQYGDFGRSGNFQWLHGKPTPQWALQTTEILQCTILNLQNIIEIFKFLCAISAPF